MTKLHISKEQMSNILALDGPKRYEHTIKQIAGWRKVWGLYNDGWGLMGDGERVFLPIWPAKEYAELCCIDEWRDYQAKCIELDEFLDTMIPDLIENQIFLSIFVTPSNKGITPTYEEFLDHISSELGKY